MLKLIEKLIRDGVIFEAIDPNDGRPPLIVWHRDRSKDEESCMGFDTLREAISDAASELYQVHQ